MSQKCSQESLRRNRNEESKWSVLALWWFLRGHQAVIENRQDNTQDAGILQQTTAVKVVLLLFQSVYLCFSLFSSFIMHTFSQYHFCQFEKSRRKRSLSVVFLLWLHCMYTIFSSPLHYFISLSLMHWDERTGQSKVWEDGEIWRETGIH